MFKIVTIKIIRKILSLFSMKIVQIEDVGHNWKREIPIILGGTPKVIFDVGANVGQTALSLHQMYPGATIYSFEPCLETFTTLQTSTASIPAIVEEHCAIGGERTETTINRYDFCNMNSILPSSGVMHEFIKHRDTKEVDSETIAVRTLTDYCEEKHIEMIDVLKIDTQGYEMEVLKGASSLLDPERIRLIFLEASLAPLYQSQAKIEDLISLLHEKGYRLVDVYDKHRDAHHCINYCDMMFARPEYFESRNL